MVNRKLCLVLVELILVVSFLQCQYHIKNGNIPSYLYHKFENIKENIFPHDIRINVSLSMISGTLLYSIDRHMNQLIVSLKNIMTPTLEIEFRKQSHYLPLSKLCGCHRCQFEILDLRIQMKDSMYVQCGSQPPEIIKYNRSKRINEEYYLPYKMITQSDDSSPNEAHLWLVNNPGYNNMYPNPKQLSGCIFNVSYNNQEIIFTNITYNIGRECTKKCIDDICNSGQCYETYNTVPVCNCTLSFLNGEYCNEKITSMNLRSVAQNFTFDRIKVSWISSVKEIAELNAINVRIQIIRDGPILNFTYSNSESTHIHSLSRNYMANSESILLVYFQDVTINTWFSNNGTWKHSVIPTNRDLRKEIFESLTVRSGSGNISLAYKMSLNDIAWSPITVLNYTAVKWDESNEMSKNVSNKADNLYKFETLVYAVIFTFVIAILLFLLLIICLVNIKGPRYCERVITYFYWKKLRCSKKGKLESKNGGHLDSDKDSIDMLSHS